MPIRNQLEDVAKRFSDSEYQQALVQVYNTLFGRFKLYEFTLAFELCRIATFCNRGDLLVIAEAVANESFVKHPPSRISRL